jgi:hypothetical protein
MSDWTYPKVSADMIRELVARIKELEKYVGFKDSGYDIISANAPRELSDEEIMAVTEPMFVLGDKEMICKFARAILKKASEK